MIFKVRYIFFLFSVLLIFSCTNSGKGNENGKDTTSGLPTVAGAGNLDDTSVLEGKALSMVSGLEEVEDVRVMVDKVTNGENHVKLVVMGTPSQNDPYYLIKVMEDNGESLVTHMSFKVNPDSSRIFYYDIVEDSLIPLETWRKQEKMK